MGNCVLRGFGAGGGRDDDEKVAEMVKVVTSNGGIMELYAPITAGCITSEFPDHGIFFRRRIEEDEQNNQFSSHPLLDTQQLHPGKLYYLLPLHSTAAVMGLPATSHRLSSSSEGGVTNGNGNTAAAAATTTAKSSWSIKGTPRKKEDPAAAESPRYNGGSNGAWKVRLVIKPERLSEILSQESSTEAFIESVRTAAKFGAAATGNNTNKNHTTTVTAGATKGTSPSSWLSSMAANDYYSNRNSVSSSWRIEQ